MASTILQSDSAAATSVVVQINGRKRRKNRLEDASVIAQRRMIKGMERIAFKSGRPSAP